MDVRRALPFVLLAALVLLAAAPVADAAKRRVPRGFYGVVWDQEVATASAAVKGEESG